MACVCSTASSPTISKDAEPLTEIGFYQLGTRPLDAVLPRLIEKALAAGHRVLVRHDDPALLARLDAALWTYEPASFLPHARDGERAAAQPVLLSAGEPVNRADLLAIPGGPLPHPLGGFVRVLYLFDGSDDAALALARDEWRRVRGMPDASPVYWREGEGGRWEKAG